ncbi:MAG: hypothetical protein EOO27_21995 [Comamonadaceae bacterium]|nr:MAG: hypothetical protein EOO27_21995 [Comamonadaceae bacterium]
MSEHRPAPENVVFTVPVSTSRPLFQSGHVVMTPGAGALLASNGLSAFDFLHRHESGDWGDLDDEDKQANTDALTNGARILSAYKLGTDRLWIITDACDDDGKRLSTCLLLPEEY